MNCDAKKIHYSFKLTYGTKSEFSCNEECHQNPSVYFIQSWTVLYMNHNKCETPDQTWAGVAGCEEMVTCWMIKERRRGKGQQHSEKKRHREQLLQRWNSWPNKWADLIGWCVAVVSCWIIRGKESRGKGQKHTGEKTLRKLLEMWNSQPNKWNHMMGWYKQQS